MLNIVFQSKLTKNYDTYIEMHVFLPAAEVVGHFLGNKKRESNAKWGSKLIFWLVNTCYRRLIGNLLFIVINPLHGTCVNTDFDYILREGRKNSDNNTYVVKCSLLIIICSKNEVVIDIAGQQRPNAVLYWARAFIRNSKFQTKNSQYDFLLRFFSSLTSFVPPNEMSKICLTHLLCDIGTDLEHAIPHRYVRDIWS